MILIRNLLFNISVDVHITEYVKPISVKTNSASKEVTHILTSSTNLGSISNFCPSLMLLIHWDFRQATAPSRLCPGLDV